MSRRERAVGVAQRLSCQIQRFENVSHDDDDYISVCKKAGDYRTDILKLLLL